MKMKKKYIRTVFGIFAFLLVGMIGFVSLTYLMRPATSSRKNICGFYAEDENSLDMVYVGGSACYMFWEPLAAWNKYGFTSYNFAADALQPQSIKYLIKEIQKTQSPELILIDARPFQYGNSFSYVENVKNMERVAPFRNVVDNMKFSKNRFDLISKWAPKQEAEWTYHFDISKYHSNMYAFLNTENWSYIRNEKRLSAKGFEYYPEAEPITFTDTCAITEERPLNLEVDDLFIDLLEYCKQQELQALFIVSAYCNSEETQPLYNYMERRCAEYGQGFLNVNDYFYEIGFDVTTDFYNADHVSLLGADKYTDFLMNYLHENYELPDKRGNLQYEQWNEDYEIWKAETDLIREQMK